MLPRALVISTPSGALGAFAPAWLPAVLGAS